MTDTPARRGGNGQPARHPGAGGRRGAGQRGRRAAPPRRPADPARRAAYDVLRAVAERDAYANLLLPAVLEQRGLAGRDAALTTELAYGTLRGRGTYDAILASCSDRPLTTIDEPVLDVLRLGTHQLLGTRVRPHAAVDTSVALAREVAGAGASRFVNAVLRRVSTRDLPAWIGEAAPSPAEDPAGYLAVRYSHPKWIVEAFSESLGEDPASGLAETQAALAADAARPTVTLCAVPGQSSRDELIAAGASPARWSPFAAYLPGGNPASVPPVAQHRAAVQDEASQLAALALTRAGVGCPDRRWLDMCAGPGGKAGLLAGLAAQAGARLAAADARPHRAALVQAAVAASGRAAVVVADGTAPAWRPASFGRVIADVPCSGLGSLRRRPEARWRKSPQDVQALAALQRRLLASAAGATRPGGVIAYVTCSPHLAETRAVVTSVTAERDDLAVLDAPAALPEVPGLRCPEPDSRFAQFWPHRHGTDAIFIALLRRLG
jgi:16S rRNA (cytosine967-C5)-methyltransferase